MANGLHQMGFADPDPTPEKKGVVGKAGVFNYSLGGSIGEIIAIADDKIFESVVWMETGLCKMGGGAFGLIGKKRRRSQTIAIFIFNNFLTINLRRLSFLVWLSKALLKSS